MAKKYELSDSEWDRIEHFFQLQRQEDQQNGIIKSCSVPFYDLLALVQLGKISRIDTLHIKVCTAVFVSGMMMGL